MSKEQFARETLPHVVFEIGETADAYRITGVVGHGGLGVCTRSSTRFPVGVATIADQSQQSIAGKNLNKELPPVAVAPPAPAPQQPAT